MRTALISTGRGAPVYLSAEEAARHYALLTAVGACTMGEDEHGIWMAGACTPVLTDIAAKREASLRLDLCGDWRALPSGDLELVGMLLVATEQDYEPDGKAASWNMDRPGFTVGRHGPE